MSDLNTILAAAYYDGEAAATGDYDLGVISADPMSEREEADILKKFPEAADVAVTLSLTYETKVVDEVATIGEAIIDSWTEGYKSFDPVSDWLDNPAWVADADNDDM